MIVLDGQEVQKMWQHQRYSFTKLSLLPKLVDFVAHVEVFTEKKYIHLEWEDGGIEPPGNKQVKQF